MTRRGITGSLAVLTPELAAQFRAQSGNPPPSPNLQRRHEDDYANALEPAVRGTRILDSALAPPRLFGVSYMLTFKGAHVLSTFAASCKADIAPHLSAMESIIASISLTDPPRD